MNTLEIADNCRLCIFVSVPTGKGPLTFCCMSMQAFDHGPWPRFTGRHRGILMNKLADLMQVTTRIWSIVHAISQVVCMTHKTE